MREQMNGFGCAEDGYRAPRRRNVMLELGELAHMAERSVFARPVGQALAPPIKGSECKPATIELASRFAVLLNVFRTAGKKQNCAF